MSVNPRIRDVVRQSWPKRQPRHAKPNRDGFPKQAKDIIETRSGGVCEIDGCGAAEVIHHRRPRGAGGTSLGWVNRAANGLHVSDACHLRIESNRMTAYVNGWLVSMNGNEISADVHVLYRGRYVLLRDDGSVKPLDGDAWDESEVLA